MPKLGYNCTTLFEVLQGYISSWMVFIIKEPS